MNRLRRGFTLIELMIVVAVIAIIAALAIPALLHARTAGHEASAVASLRTLFTINESYRSRMGDYADTLDDLATLSNLDALIAGGEKQGYSFSYAGAGRAWSCQANPIADETVNGRYFFLDNTGVIRFDRNAAADPSSALID